MPALHDFSAYLQSLVDTYRNRQDLYTLTDLQVEIRIEKPAAPGEPEARKEPKVERSPALAGLRKYSQEGHVLLVGKPGSGKSTALQRLRWELAQAALEDETQPIPVLVALRGLRSNTGILEAIAFELQKGDPNLALESNDIQRLLLKNRFFLLFDGLNEVPSDDLRADVELFRGHYTKFPMIFTSRQLGTGLGIEQTLEMCPLTEPQMRDFATRYLPEQGEDLLRSLKGSLREIAETPLLLKLLCEVYAEPDLRLFEKVGDLKSKGELFRAVDRKYNTWKTGEGVRTSEKFWQWNGELLRELAFAMLQADGSPTGKWLQVERPQAEQLLEQFLQGRVADSGEKAKDWLQDLLDHHLLQVAANPNQIEFRHQLFQEYYAAEYLLQLQHLSDAKLKRDYLNLLKWTEPLAMMLSLVTDEAQARRLVQLALAVDWKLGARLAGEVKPEFQSRTLAMLSSLKVPKQWKLGFIKFTRMVESPMWLKVQLWRTMGSDAAIPDLLKAVECQCIFDYSFYFWGLDYSFDSPRAMAMEALAHLGSTQSISGLLKALKHEDESVRSEAATVLGHLGFAEAVPGLLQALEDKIYSVRENAAAALGYLGFAEAVPGLLQALEHEDCFTRKSAAKALVAIGSAQSISGLLELIEYGDFLTREIAIDVLGQLANMYWQQYKVQAIPPFLHGSFSRKVFYENVSAVDALEKLDAARSVRKLPPMPNLLKALTASALGTIKDADLTYILPDLLTLIPTSSGEYAFAAIAAIQANCQFYNWTIHNEKLNMQTEEQMPPSGQTTNNYFDIKTLNANHSAINLGGTVRDQNVNQSHKPEP